MPESEDMVGLVIEESSDEGPLQQAPPAQDDDAASSELGTAVAPVVPSVEELQAQIIKFRAEKDQAVTGFNRERSEKDRHAAMLKQYRDAEAAAIQAQYKDNDAWLETVSNFEKYQAFQQSVLRQMVADALVERDGTMQYTQEKVEGMQAFNDLRDFATNEAKMDPDQFAAFIHQNSPIDPRTGQRFPPFHGYPPQEALRIAKALIRDQHFDRFAGQVKENAEKEADGKAKRQITNALPSGVGAGGGKPKEAESYDERYKAALSTVSANNPRDWLSH
jgi:hypothetical protein